MKLHEHLMRSLMFVPAHNERLMQSASRSIADVLLLDIEDSVQPVENKQKARDQIIKMVSEGAFKDHLVYPRVNDRESGQLLKDVHQLTIDGVHGFMYPKSKKSGDVYFFDKIIPLIEMTEAVLNAKEICKASPRVVAIAFGCEDFIGDLGGIHDDEGKSIYNPRSIIAMAAKATGVIPIDTVHIHVHDLKHLEENIILAKCLGFEGMLVLNPKELPLVHQYYSPSEKEVHDAKEMLRLYEEAQSEGKGVALMDGKFIGPPMVIMAKKTLHRHRLTEKKHTR